MKRIVVLSVALLAALAGCESLRNLLPSVERPTASVVSASLTRLSFTDAELTTRVRVENPNAVSVTLAGFSYALGIEGVPFVSGEQIEGLQIEAFGSSEFDLPVVVGFRNVVDTVDAVRDKDNAAYAIEVDLRFDLPVLGAVTVPLRREGEFPIVRPPSVRVADLSLDSIGIAGAELSLTVGVENPNGFAFTITSIDYALAVGDRLWVEGQTERPRTVPANGREEITARFSLNFASFGRTVRDLLLGGAQIDYSFVSNLRIYPDIELLPEVTFPFEREGSIPLRRP